MKRFFFISSLVWFNYQTTQAQPCIIEPTAEEQAYLSTFRTPMRSFDNGDTHGVRDFPIMAHIVTQSNGNGGASFASIERAIKHLNSTYIQANIRFVLLEQVNYIKNSAFYSFDVVEEEAMCQANDVSGVINMYFVGSATMDGTSLCGYAYFPNSKSYLMKKDRVIMQNGCINDEATLPHEMGHYFSLYHTHGKGNFTTTDELVDGSNCKTAGDELCDTPADPGLIGKINGYSCTYSGRDTDSKGRVFTPDVTNIMSYSNARCLESFSPQQFSRINYAAFNLRKYLKFPTDISKNTTKNPPTTASINTQNTKILHGELELLIENASSVPTVLDGNLYKSKQSYPSGTSYRIAITSTESAYMYIISSDLSNKVNKLFPENSKTAFLGTNKKIYLPSENQRYMMDNVRGKDYFCVLYSKQELSIDSLLEWMKVHGTGTFVQRLYQVLGDYIVPSSQIKYSETGKLSFSATTYNKQSIVPIIIELKHH